MTERNVFALWLCAVILLALLNVFGWVSRAECWDCPGFPCQIGQCPYPCACAILPGEGVGFCVSNQ